MPNLSDYTLDQLLAVGLLADAPENIRALDERQIDELRLIQLRELMHVYDAMRATVSANDPKTWVYGDEAEAYFDQHVWPWHVNLLLKLLDQARAGHYVSQPEDVPRPAAGPLPFPYNVYAEGDLNNVEDR
jgi:hypothetical protein